MMMEPTTLAGLIATPSVEMTPKGIRVDVLDSWIVPGENRLSYASAIRLAECCREYHWRRDLAVLAPSLDSIVVRCDANFTNPVIVGTRIQLLYAVTRINGRSYECTITIGPAGCAGSTCLARVVLTNVFYDADSQEAIDPPPRVVEALQSLSAED